MTWAQELDETSGVDAHVVLTGNSLDSVILPGPQNSGAGQVTARVLPVFRALLEIASRIGIEFAVVADPLAGFRLAPLGIPIEKLRQQLPEAIRELPALDSDVNEKNRSENIGIAPTELGVILRHVAQAPLLGAVVVVDAGRWIVDPASLQPDEHSLFAVASSLARNSIAQATSGGRMTHAPVWWLCRSDYELPSWYLNSLGVRTIAVPRPSTAEREALATTMLESAAPRDFADHTDSMSVHDVTAVADLVEADRTIDEAATLVRLGVVDDPWASPDLLDRLGAGAEFLRSRVKGQEAALTSAWSAMTRTLMGLSGIHRRGHARRPRVVLFLAGPTGTGKTELAKTIAELIFGSTDALLRFDMSGYSAEHSDQRLVGAPPGYVGHEAGGELTNAVRARPFSVVLLDEIEKAHPRILDKFLQVLDEGQLDDGLGRRVYFDQTVVIFTSNLGISEQRTRPDGTVERVFLVNDEMPYEQVRETVHAAISRYFTEVIGRAEILNRLGDNIAVFDFLRPPAPRQVFDILLNNVTDGLRERRSLEFTLSPSAVEELADSCCAASSKFGGRGIENKVESLVVNPLSVWLFEHRDENPTRLHVREWSVDSTLGTPILGIDHG